MKKKLQGFGVLEVLISSSIIIIMLGALLSVGFIALANGENLQIRSQAQYLAQEGLEVARQSRDTAWIDEDKDTEWDDFGDKNNSITTKLKTQSQVSGKFSTIDKKFVFVGDGSWESGAALSLQGTGFERQITFSRVDAALMPASVHPEENAIKVTVEVKWTANGLSKSIKASEILTNWRPSF